MQGWNALGGTVNARSATEPVRLAGDAPRRALPGPTRILNPQP